MIENSEQVEESLLDLTELPIPLENNEVFAVNSFQELLSMHSGVHDDDISDDDGFGQEDCDEPLDCDGDTDENVLSQNVSNFGQLPSSSSTSHTSQPSSMQVLVSNASMINDFKRHECTAMQHKTGFKLWSFLTPKLPTESPLDNHADWSAAWKSFKVPSVGNVPLVEAHVTSTASRQFGPVRKPTPWSCQLKADRARALTKWGLIIEDGIEHTTAGKQLLELKRTACTEEVYTCMIQDIFQPKSTSTLQSRADALILFSRWKQLIKPGSNLFPIFEPEVYDYLCSLRATGKPPTRASRFVEAIHFAGGMLGFELDQFRNSARLMGVVRSIASFKKERVKRDPLTRKQVLCLEVALLSSQLPLFELVFIGFILFLVYTRCRFSDTKYCTCEPKLDLDRNGHGFIEASLYDHKTANSTAKRFRLLPVVGPVIGVSGENWAEPFLKARKQSGLEASRSSPLMPAFSISGYVQGSAMSVQEANIFLCHILEKVGAPKESSQVLGTHSCKATTLSWMAKASVNEVHRRLLGYHAAPGEHVMLEYSRDALAGPLSSLVAVIRCIRLQKFLPDETRSGRWQVGCSLEHDGVEVVSMPQDDVFEDPELGLTDGSQCDSTHSSDSEKEVQQACAGLSLRHIGPAAGLEFFFKHNITGTFHKKGIDGNLACGRKESTCTPVDGSETILFPKCKVCFGNAQESVQF